MHAIIPRNWNGLLLLADVRNRADAELSIERPDLPHVLDLWGPGRDALGPQGWAQTARVALFDNGDTVSAQDRAFAKVELTRRIEDLKPKAIAVLQTRSATARRSQQADAEGAVSGADGTIVWSFFQAPGSIAELAGTVFESRFGPAIAILNPVNLEYVHSWITRKHLRRALGLAKGEGPRACPHPIWEPGVDMSDALVSIWEQASAGAPVSVDIESVPSTQTITCIGLAAGDCAVAVPWDSYRDVNGSTPAVSDKDWAFVKSILETESVKVGHNFIASDIPALAARNVRLNGELHDTLIMHGLCFPQFRHGLQHAVSSLLAAPPWKSLYKPPCKSSAAPGYWAWDWRKLGEYNCGDTWWTLQLYHELAWRCGMAA